MATFPGSSKAFARSRYGPALADFPHRCLTDIAEREGLAAADDNAAQFNGKTQPPKPTPKADPGFDGRLETSGSPRYATRLRGVVPSALPCAARRRGATPATLISVTPH